MYKKSDDKQVKGFANASPDYDELYRRMAEEAPIILWMTGPDGRSNFFNQRWHEFTGLSGEKLRGGKAWFQALHPDDRERCLGIIRSSFTTHRPMELTYRLRDHNGEYCWMLDKSRPCYGDNGRFLGYIGATIDINERHAMEEALARSNAELARANEDANRLRSMNDHLLVCGNIDEIHAVLMHFAPKLFTGSSGAIFMSNDSNTLVEVVAHWGNFDMDGTTLVHEDCWALRQGKPHRVTMDEGLSCAHLEGQPRHDYLCAPLIAHGDILGLLYLYCQDEEELAEHCYRFALTAAENLSLALSSFKMREVLRHQSVRDPLTKLYNRRYMLESLDRELARAQRRDYALAVVMVDIDHFKDFNDTYGHAAGDAALKAFGQYLDENLRGEDIASRYGGEEFVIVLVDVDKESVLKRIDKLRVEASRLTIDLHGQILDTFTLSAGVAYYPDNGKDAMKLLEQADRALYRAKREGRDRACIAENEPPTEGATDVKQ